MIMASIVDISYNECDYVLEMQKILCLIKNSKGNISSDVAQKMRSLSIDWLENSTVEGGSVSYFRNNSQNLYFHDSDNSSFKSYCDNRRKKVFTGVEQADFFVELVNLALGRKKGNLLNVSLPSKELNLKSSDSKTKDTIFIEHNGSNHWSSHRAKSQGVDTKGINNDCLFFSLAHEINSVVDQNEIGSVYGKNIEKYGEIYEDSEKSKLSLQELADFQLALYVNENPDLSSEEVNKKGFEIRLGLGLEKVSTTPVYNNKYHSSLINPEDYLGSASPAA